MNMLGRFGLILMLGLMWALLISIAAETYPETPSWVFNGSTYIFAGGAAIYGMFGGGD